MKTPVGYQFDVLAETLAREIAAGVAGARRKIHKPLRAMTIWRDASESFLPRSVLLYWKKAGRWLGYDEAEVLLDAPVIDTKVPFSVFDVEDGGDRVLPAFLRRNGLPRHDGWGETLAVPRILLHLELTRAYLTLPQRLAEAGVPLAKDFQVWDHSPDGVDVLKASSFDEEIRRDLRKRLKTETQLREFAALCYAAEDRQAWLVSLGPKSTAKTRAKPAVAGTTRAKRVRTRVARSGGPARVNKAGTGFPKKPGRRRRMGPGKASAKPPAARSAPR